MSDDADRRIGFEVTLQERPALVLFAELLRDGRVALGTRSEERDGSWAPGELHLLEPGAYLDLAAWLSPRVEEAWIESVRERRAEPLRTARELYGEGAAGATRLAFQMLQEIPPALLCRAMILLANSIGPEARDRLVQRLNQTRDRGEDASLRRRLVDQHEAFAYAVAAAALFDAVAQGLADDPEHDPAGG